MLSILSAATIAAVYVVQFATTCNTVTFSYIPFASLIDKQQTMRAELLNRRFDPSLAPVK